MGARIQVEFDAASRVALGIWEIDHDALLHRVERLDPLDVTRLAAHLVPTVSLDRLPDLFEQFLDMRPVVPNLLAQRLLHLGLGVEALHRLTLLCSAPAELVCHIHRSPPLVHLPGLLLLTTRQRGGVVAALPGVDRRRQGREFAKDRPLVTRECEWEHLGTVLLDGARDCFFIIRFRLFGEHGDAAAARGQFISEVAKRLHQRPHARDAHFGGY